MAGDHDQDADDADGDGEGWVCGSDETTSTDGPCQFPVGDADERCHMHPRDGSGPPENHGDARGSNKLAGRGSVGGHAPEGNKNALSHGLYAAEQDATGLFGYFREHDPPLATKIRRVFWTYMDDAPFEAYPGDADRYSPPVLDHVSQDASQAADAGGDDVDDQGDAHVAQAAPRQHAAADAPPVSPDHLTGKADRLFDICVHQVLLKGVTLRQVRELLTQDDVVISEGDVVVDPTDGEPVEIEDELPVNLPKSRMRQRDIRELKDLGILDDPQSQTADAMASWGEAVRRSTMREEQDPDD